MATVLIVDDYAIALRLLSHILTRANHEAITASNGLEALDLLDQHPIDLVILDIDMPEMDGITVLKRIRADARFQSLPVVMLTASGHDEDRIHAEAAGADGFLTKPVSSDEIINLVKHHVDD